MAIPQDKEKVAKAKSKPQQTEAQKKTDFIKQAFEQAKAQIKIQVEKAKAASAWAKTAADIKKAQEERIRAQEQTKQVQEQTKQSKIDTAGVAQDVSAQKTMIDQEMINQGMEDTTLNEYEPTGALPNVIEQNFGISIPQDPTSILNRAIVSGDPHQMQAAMQSEALSQYLLSKQTPESQGIFQDVLAAPFNLLGSIAQPVAGLFGERTTDLGERMFGSLPTPEQNLARILKQQEGFGQFASFTDLNEAKRIAAETARQSATERAQATRDVANIRADAEKAIKTAQTEAKQASEQHRIDLAREKLANEVRIASMEENARERIANINNAVKGAEFRLKEETAIEAENTVDASLSGSVLGSTSKSGGESIFLPEESKAFVDYLEMKKMLVDLERKPNKTPEDNAMIGNLTEGIANTVRGLAINYIFDRNKRPEDVLDPTQAGTFANKLAEITLQEMNSWVTAAKDLGGDKETRQLGQMQISRAARNRNAAFTFIADLTKEMETLQALRDIREKGLKDIKTQYFRAVMTSHIPSDMEENVAAIRRRSLEAVLGLYGIDKLPSVMKAAATGNIKALLADIEKRQKVQLFR